MNNESELILQKIREENPITDFLASHGLQSHRSYNDKYIYSCPLPNHNESKPSFVVYDKEDYQNFYCFGCKASGCIVKLYSLLENKTWKESIVSLGGEFAFTNNDVLEYIIRKLKNNISSKKEHEAKNILYEISFKLRHLAYMYMERVDFDPREVERVESFYFVVDHTIVKEDLNSLIEIFDFVNDVDGTGKNLFEISYYRWCKVKEQEYGKVRDLLNV